LIMKALLATGILVALGKLRALVEIHVCLL
jgi:hypothetical protein